MKPALSLSCLPLAAVLALPAAAAAQSSAPRIPMSGTQISLTTSAARVIPRSSVEGTAGARLAATVKLSNRSRQAILHSFPDLASARSKFTFALYDASGELIWTGPGQAPARAAEPSSPEQVLLPRASWTATAAIPLVLDGEWLAPGLYRVEAALDAEPSAYAGATFEVLPAPVLEPPVRPWPPGVNDPIQNPKPGFPRDGGQRIGSVDQLTVERVAMGESGEGLKITASGWVNSGGWSQPRLVAGPLPMIYPPPSLPFDFLATPPPPGMAVTMALVRVTASATIPLVPGAPSVTVHAASNSLTREIPPAR